MEVLTFKTPPVQQRCIKEQLRALFIKLLSLVSFMSCLNAFKMQLKGVYNQESLQGQRSAIVRHAHAKLFATSFT